MKPPSDLQEMCDDLKVLGRREFAHLIRLKHKYNTIIEKEEKVKRQEEEEEKTKALSEEDEDAKIDKELEETMKRIEQAKKRQAKKDKIIADKSDLRKKMSVIATNTLDNDEDLHLTSRQWDAMRKSVKGQNSSDEEEEKDEASEESSDGDEESDPISSDEEDDDDEMDGE